MEARGSESEGTGVRDELRRLIGEVIGADPGSVGDDVPILDFVTSSLDLVEGMRRVYERFGVIIPIRRIIEGQADLSALAAQVEQELAASALRRRGVPEADSEERDGRGRDRIRLAPSQDHVGFLTRYSREASAAFNEARLLRLRGALDVERLEKAVQTVARRHEALRAGLSLDENAFELADDEAMRLPLVDCPSERLPEELVARIARPFELGERMFRAELFRLAPDDHGLLLLGHALVLDHEGLGLAMEDVARVYRHGGETDDPPRTLQLTELRARRDAAPARRARAAAEEHWRTVFAEGVPALELPADRPRPSVKSYEGAELALPLGARLEERLRAFSNGRTSSLAAVFGGFTLLLHRISGQESISLGVETRGPEIGLDERAVASARTTVPVLARYDGEKTFSDHVSEGAVLLAEAYNYGQLSLAGLIRSLELPRDQSRSALFSVGFRSVALEAGPDLGELESSWESAPGAGARYDLGLTLLDAPEGMELRFGYSTDLFDGGTIERFGRAMLALLSSGMEEPSTPCSRLPLLSPEERHEIVESWNASERAFPLERTALDLFDERCAARPDRPAIRALGEELTYGELRRRVEEVASELLARGVTAGDRVAVLLPRAADLVATMLAVWRVGAAYVPLDTSFPAKRLELMLGDAEVALVVTTSKARDACRVATDLPVLLAEETWAGRDASAWKSRRAAAGDTAYVIYTSGSTGRPKGVEISHASVTNFLLSTKEALSFGATDVLLALTTVSFDISVLEIFLPLIAGGIVELGEEGLSADGIRLSERLDEGAATFVQATPSTWKLVLAASWGGDSRLHALSAGEALDRDLAEALLPKVGSLWNLYGPTEATVFTASHRVESKPGAPLPIGRPYPNTQLYVLDAHGEPVPVGVTGELYIGGVGVARGYFRRPDLTRERFLPSPFRPGERLYRTGDLARHLPSGEVLCLGRLDDQVKIHGVRVELGEVEAALREIDGLRDAVATSFVDDSGDRQLVAHVLAAPTGAPLPAEIRRRLRQRLPESMIPPHVLFAESFPRTANGKVARSALPEPGPVEGGAARESASPTTATERLLAGAWSRVLGVPVEGVGREDTFLDLGGHSLLMTHLMLELRKLFQVSFNMRELFGAPTLRELSELIDARRGPAPRESATRSRSAEWGRQRMAFLAREAELPRSVAPARGLVFEPGSESGTALLTGATGFIGAYLVSDILGTTSGRLVCLVRPKRDEPAKGRIEKQLRKFGLWSDEEWWRSAWAERVDVVEGDVTLPRMGVADGVYERMAREIDFVLHSAAHVNFIYPYEALRATNVLGVHEVIRFAFHARIKPVHYLSTAAIWPMGAEKTFFEIDPIDHDELLNLGYDEAKWVGERCLLHAADRGLPVARYRPGEVGGDSRTGRSVLDHFLIAAIKGFLQAGAFPVIDAELDVAPADYVSKAVVHMVYRGNALGRAFHLTNPRRCHVSEALGFLRDAGYRFEQLPFEQIRDHLVASPEFGENALFPYQAMLEDFDTRSFELPRYDCRETLRELEGTDIVCPPVGEELLGTYLRYLVSTGYLPEPAEMPSARARASSERHGERGATL